MYLLRNNRVIEVRVIKSWEGTTLSKDEQDLGTLEEALARVERELAAVNEEKESVLLAQEGRIPLQNGPSRKKKYVYRIGDDIYSCTCEYDNTGNLMSYYSERMGTKEKVLEEYDRLLSSLKTRYQALLNAAKETS